MFTVASDEFVLVKYFREHSRLANRGVSIRKLFGYIHVCDHWGESKVSPHSLHLYISSKYHQQYAQEKKQWYTCILWKSYPWAPFGLTITKIFKSLTLIFGRRVHKFYVKIQTWGWVWTWVKLVMVDPQPSSAMLVSLLLGKRNETDNEPEHA